MLLDDALSRPSHWKVLRCLHACIQGISGREIARQTGLSHQQAHNALRALAAMGLVERKVVAPAYVFRLNKDHWVFKEALSAIFSKEARWLEGLLETAARGLPRCARSLILFGSAAAGRLRPGSDIDLLALVARESEKKAVVDHFAERSAEVMSGFHYPLAPVVMSIEEFRLGFRKKNPFARAVLRTGRVIRGRLLTEIL